MCTCARVTCAPWESRFIARCARLCRPGGLLLHPAASVGYVCSCVSLVCRASPCAQTCTPSLPVLTREPISIGAPLCVCMCSALDSIIPCTSVYLHVPHHPLYVCMCSAMDSTIPCMSVVCLCVKRNVGQCVCARSCACACVLVASACTASGPRRWCDTLFLHVPLKCPSEVCWVLSRAAAAPLPQFMHA